LFTTAVWGARNNSLVIATNNGKILCYSLEHNQFIEEIQVHREEIYSLQLTHDYTMLMTGSKDGTAKLLNPETFAVQRSFNYGKPCRSASISPLYDDPEH